MLNKKGIALETAVALIIGIVFLVVVLYILLKTGILSTFQSNLYGFMCTASSYGRGILIGLILMVWGILSIVIEVVMIISGGPAAVAGLVSLPGSTLELVKNVLRQTPPGGLTGAVFMLITFLSFSTLVTYLAVIPMVSNIPLLCPSTTIDVGTQDQKISEFKFLGEISASTVDCWNMYGGGSLDPLIGLDPPNPRECRILETYISNTTPMNVSRIYNYMRTAYGNNWLLGEDKLFVYCYLGNTVEKLGNKASDWVNKCSFDKARIYIMFRDKHDYDLIAYGTSVCNRKIFESDFDGVKDAMVWCIEKI